MNTFVGALHRFWDWQWRIHYATKRLVCFCSSSADDRGFNSGVKSSPKDVTGKAGGSVSPPAPVKQNGPKPYSRRNMIGLIGGIVVLIIGLLMPPPGSMYRVAGKMAVEKSSPEVINAGAEAKVLTLNKKGKVQEVSDLKAFLNWSMQAQPKIYKATQDSAKAMKNCLAVMFIMVIWWICESVPWGVAALLPAAIFPLSGVATAGKASAPYANPTIILFIAAFFIAEAMLKWNLHRRIALFIVDKIGVSPRRIVLGFMVACAFLSMWISNTATAMMMMPMALAIILHTVEVGKRLQEQGQLKGVNFTAGAYVFGSCLMLGIAYASNSGGMGTLIGTPPNLIYAGQLQLMFPGSPKVDFARWLIIGVPLAWITTIGLWALLVFWLRRPEIEEVPGGPELIKEERAKMGPWSRGEKAVGIIFLLTALAWIFSGEKKIGDTTIYGLQTIFPWIDDSTIAVFMAVALFCIPISLEKNDFALTWDWAVKIPWGIVLLFGGGFSLAAAISATGAGTWVGNQLAGLADWPLVMLMLAVATVVAAVSTVATNTAVTAIFMPILGTMALATAFDPRFLMILGCLAAQCAYGLPVSTTGNAICFGSGYIDMMDMVKVGIVCSIVAILIAVFGSLILMGPAFGVSPSVIPAWVTGG